MFSTRGFCFLKTGSHVVQFDLRLLLLLFHLPYSGFQACVTTPDPSNGNYTFWTSCIFSSGKLFHYKNYSLASVFLDILLTFRCNVFRGWTSMLFLVFLSHRKTFWCFNQAAQGKAVSFLALIIWCLPQDVKLSLHFCFPIAVSRSEPQGPYLCVLSFPMQCPRHSAPTYLLYRELLSMCCLIWCTFCISMCASTAWI